MNHGHRILRGFEPLPRAARQKKAEYMSESFDLGRVLNHDDSVNDRGPGSKLSTSDKTTRELWTNTFKSDFAKNGSMFRGDPPDLHIIPVPLDFSYKLATKVSSGEMARNG